MRSIQSTVDHFRSALGGKDNRSLPGPLSSGRREINWDGCGLTLTAVAPTPFTAVLNTRGALFTTGGTGLVRTTAVGPAPTFGNPGDLNVPSPSLASRQFRPIRSTITEITFFVPWGGHIPAATSGFGAILCGADERGGIGAGGTNRSRVTIDCFDADWEPLYSSTIPFSPGDGGPSFTGIIFKEPRIACVRVTSHHPARGSEDARHGDAIMLDDFIFGEPRRRNDVASSNHRENDGR